MYRKALSKLTFGTVVLACAAGITYAGTRLAEVLRDGKLLAAADTAAREQQTAPQSTAVVWRGRFDFQDAPAFEGPVYFCLPNGGVFGVLVRNLADFKTLRHLRGRPVVVRATLVTYENSRRAQVRGLFIESLEAVAEELPYPRQDPITYDDYSGRPKD